MEKSENTDFFNQSFIPIYAKVATGEKTAFEFEKDTVQYEFGILPVRESDCSFTLWNFGARKVIHII